MWATTPCPSPDAELAVIQRFALSYDGYGRIARDPATLHRVVRPVVTAVKAGKAVPLWVALDLLRAALFYLQREGRATEYAEPVNEVPMRVLVREIALHIGVLRLPDDHALAEPRSALAEGFKRRDRQREGLAGERRTRRRSSATGTGTGV